MPVTAEELRKLAESRMPRGTPTADELRELAESRKQKTEFKPFGFGIELSQPQPEKPRSPIEEVQYQKAKAQEKATNKAVGITKFALDIAGGPGTLFYPKNNVMLLQKDWFDYEVSKCKKGKPKPANPIEAVTQMGQAVWQGLTLKQKTTMTDFLSRFVEDIPEQQC